MAESNGSHQQQQQSGEIEAAGPPEQAGQQSSGGLGQRLRGLLKKPTGRGKGKISEESRKGKRERPADAVRMGCGGLFRRRKRQPEAAEAATSEDAAEKKPVEKPVKSKSVKGGTVKTDHSDADEAPVGAESQIQLQLDVENSRTEDNEEKDTANADSQKPEVAETFSTEPEENIKESTAPRSLLELASKSQTQGQENCRPEGKTEGEDVKDEKSDDSKSEGKDVVKDEKSDDSKSEGKDAKDEKSDDSKSEGKDAKDEKSDDSKSEGKDAKDEKSDDSKSEDKETEETGNLATVDETEEMRRQHKAAEDELKRASADQLAKAANKPGVKIEQGPQTEMWSGIVSKSLVGTGMFQRAAACNLSTGGVLACTPGDFAPTVQQVAALREGFDCREQAFGAAGFGLADTVYRLQEETASKELLCGVDDAQSHAVLVCKTNTALLAAACSQRVEVAASMLSEMRSHFIAQGV